MFKWRFIKIQTWMCLTTDNPKDMKMSFGLSMVCLRFCVIFLLFVAETNFVFTKLNMHGGKVFGVV